MQLVRDLGSVFWADLEGRTVSPIFSNEDDAWDWLDSQNFEDEA